MECSNNCFTDCYVSSSDHAYLRCQIVKEGCNDRIMRVPEAATSSETACATIYAGDETHLTHLNTSRRSILRYQATYQQI